MNTNRHKGLPYSTKNKRKSLEHKTDGLLNELELLPPGLVIFGLVVLVIFLGMLLICLR